MYTATNTLWRQTQYQEALESVLHNIFPRHNILSNSVKKEETPNASRVFVDVEIPSLSLCFEYQDVYHYKTAFYYHQPLNVVQQKDDSKRTKLVNELQTLISIPCWWDGDIESLQATITFQRPDLEETQSSQAIPSNPPSNFFEGNTNHSPLMLAAFPEANMMERGSWWIGEKWDGIRCYWDAKEKQLCSRNEVTIPFQSHPGNVLGNMVLDAELWCGRGFYGESQLFVSVTEQKIDSSFVRLLCFDEASKQVQLQPFEERYSLILSNLPKEHPAAINAPRFLCMSDSMLQDTLRCIMEEGGEGVMARKPLSLYSPGRSKSLYKIKGLHTYTDHEALVTRAGGDGSLLLQMPNGVTFTVEKQDSMLHRSAVKGDIVTFRVEVPNNKSNVQWIHCNSKLVVYRIRTDLVWEDVLRYNFNFSVPKLEFDKREEDVMLTNTGRRTPASPLHSRVGLDSFVASKGIERVVLDSFAASKGMDSLNSSFWYHVTPSELARSVTNFKAMANKYGPKLSNIIMQIYPDIGLRKIEFRAHANLRKLKRAKHFFSMFAASKGMDPRNPVFWYHVTPREVTDYANKQNIPFNYDLSYSMLTQLFPDIGLQPNKFRGYLNVGRHNKRRAFFDSFASSHSMDPLNPFFWYTITPSQLIKYDKKRYKRMVQGEKLATVLARMYPNIGFKQHCFNENRRKDNRHTRARKVYFDKFAEAKGMDSLNPIFWHTVAPTELAQYAQKMNVDSGFFELLTQIYSDIGLQQVKLSNTHAHQRTQHYTAVQAATKGNEKKEFLDRFARSKGMDALNPTFWYSVTANDLLLFDKIYVRISRCFGNSLSKILLHFYPNIGLQRSQIKESRSWRLKSARKDFFDSFALSKGMDPHSVSFWYTVTTSDLIKFDKGFKSIHQNYGRNLFTILVDIYPSLHFNRK